MGGYVTLPVAVAARLARVPVVLHEQNAIPGIANRLAARFARKVALGVEAAAEAFPAARTITVGNPVRPELARLDRNRLRELGQKELGLDPDRATLFVFGGSQGARHVNQALVAATPYWPHPERIQILHACGRRDEADVRQAWRAAAPEARGLQVRVEPFIERMDLAYAACDLAITRAGAVTVAELTATGVPAILVPLPHAAADHQAGNARAVAAAGGGLVVRDADLTGERLAATAAPRLARVLPGRAGARRGPRGHRLVRGGPRAHGPAGEQARRPPLPAPGGLPADRAAARARRRRRRPRAPAAPQRWRREGRAVSGQRRVHLVGIGGTGMSALARLLLETGYQVTGSDHKETPVLATLRGLGAEIWLGQRDGERMGDPDMVATSSAIRPGNPEVLAARQRGIPVLGRAEMLARAMAGKATVAVAGTAGKTTTTGMVVSILEEAGLDPSFAIGGDFMSSG